MKPTGFLTAILISLLVLTGPTACSSSSSSSQRSTQTNSKPSRASSEKITLPEESSSTRRPYDLDYLSEPQEPTYENELWPTRNADLLAVPEENRWHNAAQHMGTTCTVVGPVANVYQAKQSQGMPIFVDIGQSYPSSGNVTLLIWAQDADPFMEMLNAVDDGGAWLSVTGYLNNYEGMPQFNSAMSWIEFQWWTNVS